MFTIRKATPEDTPAIVDFQLQMAKETEGIVLDEDTINKGVEAVFHDPGKGTYFVALQDTKVVASLLITYEWSDWRNGNIWWIQSVFVVPTARGKGAFKALYDHVKDNVVGSGELRGIRLYVERGNHRAQEVYRRLGMDGDHYQVFEWIK